jgi:hypothetical protein
MYHPQECGKRSNGGLRHGVKSRLLLYLENTRRNQMTSVTIRFEGGNVDQQSHGPVSRIVGFVSARSLIPLFDIADLAANPRVAKVGDVTDSIRESIVASPAIFPFLTKGVLIGTTSYESLERNRYRLNFENPDYEGIMDGGHNMLAIGLHILDNVAAIPSIDVRRAKDWPKFKELWLKHRDEVIALATNGAPEETEFLDFVVPVEIDVPRDPDSENGLNTFRASLKDICDARNHNVQLRDEALANRAGLYDALREALDPSLEKRVEWKQNEGGDVKAREIIALAMIPLNQIELPSSLTPINVTSPYSAKGACVNHFNDIMVDDTVSTESPDGTRRVVTNPTVISAFDILAKLPEVYDEIYKLFPQAYNQTGARFGTIPQVKQASATFSPTSKFTNQEVPYQYPDGFIYPIVMALGELIKVEGSGTLSWKTDPLEFIREHMTSIVADFQPHIDFCDRNPQKVGKTAACYNVVSMAFRLCLAK